MLEFRGKVVRTMRFESGAWRTCEVFVVTGTDSRAIRKRDPKTQRTTLAQGPGDALPIIADIPGSFDRIQ
jgi:hypothetical protein